VSLRAGLVTLAIPVGTDDPPSDVLLFRSGPNTSTQGEFVFDAQAALSVIAAARKHGVDVMIDLEHLSLDPSARNYDPDARGSGRLELRDGALWLTDIRWTEDGAARIRGKRQRYVSPAFEVDPKTRRVARVVNVAITSLPATDYAMPLVAASQYGDTKPMPKEMRKLLGLADDATDEEMMKTLTAKLARLAELEKPKPEADEAMHIAASARKHTGKTKPEEVEAVLVALAQTRSAATDMGAELATLRASMLRNDLRELCRSNPRKIAAPKLEALVMASQTIESATALVDALPELPSMVPLNQPARPAESETVTLTDSDREVARLTGSDLAKVLQFKRDRAAAQERV